MFPFSTAPLLVGDARKKRSKVSANFGITMTMEVNGADVSKSPSPQLVADIPSSAAAAFLLIADKRRRSSSIVIRGKQFEARALIGEAYACRIQCHSSRLSAWSFDVFEWSTGMSRPMTHLAQHILLHHDALRLLQIDYLTLLRCLGEIEASYFSHNPYHTALHAADVLQAVHCFILQPSVASVLKPFDKVVLLLAALCHDICHPGYTANFCHQDGHHLTSEKALKYLASTSILENHHSRYALNIFTQYGLNRRAYWPEFRVLLRRLILATDMANHEKYLDAFRTAVSNNGGNFNNSSHAPVLMEFLIKCADINNPARRWTTCRRWCDNVCNEFFRQGDLERRRGYKISYLCDRQAVVVPEMQVGFISHMVLPLFQLWHDFSGSTLTHDIIETLNENRERWDTKCSMRRGPLLCSPPPPSPAATTVTEADEAVIPPPPVYFKARRASEGTPLTALPTFKQTRRCSNGSIVQLPLPPNTIAPMS